MICPARENRARRRVADEQIDAAATQIFIRASCFPEDYNARRRQSTSSTSRSPSDTLALPRPSDRLTRGQHRHSSLSKLSVSGISFHRSQATTGPERHSLVVPQRSQIQRRSTHARNRLVPYSPRLADSSCCFAPTKPGDSCRPAACPGTATCAKIRKPRALSLNAAPTPPQHRRRRHSGRTRTLVRQLPARLSPPAPSAAASSSPAV